jgi:hypothetical protein
MFVESTAHNHPCIKGQLKGVPSSFTLACILHARLLALRDGGAAEPGFRKRLAVVGKGFGREAAGQSASRRLDFEQDMLVPGRGRVLCDAVLVL